MARRLPGLLLLTRLPAAHAREHWITQFRRQELFEHLLAIFLPAVRLPPLEERLGGIGSGHDAVSRRLSRGIFWVERGQGIVSCRELPGSFAPCGALQTCIAATFIAPLLFAAIIGESFLNCGSC